MILLVDLDRICTRLPGSNETRAYRGVMGPIAWPGPPRISFSSPLMFAKLVATVLGSAQQGRVWNCYPAEHNSPSFRLSTFITWRSFTIQPYTAAVSEMAGRTLSLCMASPCPNLHDDQAADTERISLPMLSYSCEDFVHLLYFLTNFVIQAIFQICGSQRECCSPENTTTLPAACCTTHTQRMLLASSRCPSSMRWSMVLQFNTVLMSCMTDIPWHNNLPWSHSRAVTWVHSTVSWRYHSCSKRTLLLAKRFCAYLSTTFDADSDHEHPPIL